MGLGTSTLKSILLLLNFIFAVFGLVLLGFGIFILVSAPEHKTVVNREETTVDIGEKLAGGLVIALGIIIVIASILGCLAANHESKRKLIIYMITLVTLILLQVLMSGMASQGKRDGLAGSVQRGFDSLWEEEKMRVVIKGESSALCYYERWLHCCGVNGTIDYDFIEHPVPKSCCLDENCDVADNLFTEGCQQKFNDYLANKMLIFNTINGLVIVGEIVAMVFSWLLYSSLKNESRRSNLTWM